MKKLIEGLLFLMKIFVYLIHQICKNLENLLELYKRKRKKEKGTPACCIKIPEDKRPRPDPYIYSQDWLIKRGIAVTWQNPDFKILDVSGNEVPSDQLLPNTQYEVEVIIHNNSPMASLNTDVSLTIHPFGIQTGVIWGSPKNTLDVPAVGFSKTKFTWETPNQIGHVCLIATIFHIDDANPLNNIGQHNTSIIGDTAEKLSFKMNNFSKSTQQVLFMFDTYSLPSEPVQARSAKELKSASYLRKLQSANSISSASFNQIKVLKNIKNEIILEPNAELEIEINQSIFINTNTLNITAYSDNQVLLGGVTFIKPI